VGSNLSKVSAMLVDILGVELVICISSVLLWKTYEILTVVSAFLFPPKAI
jgi:hypothetical protein